MSSFNLSGSYDEDLERAISNSLMSGTGGNSFQGSLPPWLPSMTPDPTAGVITIPDSPPPRVIDLTVPNPNDDFTSLLSNLSINRNTSLPAPIPITAPAIGMSSGVRSNPLGIGSLLNYTSPSVSTSYNPLPPPASVRSSVPLPIPGLNITTSNPGPVTHVPSTLTGMSNPIPPISHLPNKHERTREEIEQSARRLSRVEAAQDGLDVIRQPYEDAKARYEKLLRKLNDARENMEALEEHYNDYKNTLSDSSAIIEHQNIERDRALLFDKYGITVSSKIPKSPMRSTSVSIPNPNLSGGTVMILPSPIISSPIMSVPPIPIPTVPVPVGSPRTQFEMRDRENDMGTVVKLRFVYPDGRKSEHVTRSKQQLGTITAFASGQYGKPLRMAGIPGVTINPNMTLEDIGFISSGLFKFFE